MRERGRERERESGLLGYDRERERRKRVGRNERECVDGTMRKEKKNGRTLYFSYWES